MGGSIGVASVFGQGSDFFVTLPFGRSPDRLESCLSEPSLARKRLLVVDRSAASLALLTAQLTAWGAKVTAVASGIEALGLALQAARIGKGYNGVLIAEETADLHGEALATMLRKNSVTSRLKTVLMAARVLCRPDQTDSPWRAGFLSHRNFCPQRRQEPGRGGRRNTTAGRTAPG
jgi:two-component system sensor histidine kinase/response regulator